MDFKGTRGLLVSMELRVIRVIRVKWATLDFRAVKAHRETKVRWGMPELKATKDSKDSKVLVMKVFRAIKVSKESKVFKVQMGKDLKDLKVFKVSPVVLKVFKEHRALRAT